MLREEQRLNGACMRRIDPYRRPQYTAVERMAILELRAMRGWSKAETARRFFVNDDNVDALRQSQRLFEIPQQGVWFLDAGRQTNRIVLDAKAGSALFRHVEHRG